MCLVRIQSSRIVGSAKSAGSIGTRGSNPRRWSACIARSAGSGFRSTMTSRSTVACTCPLRTTAIPPTMTYGTSASAKAAYTSSYKPTG